MKRIEAFLRPHRLGKVIAALHALPHFPGFTVFDAHGQGHGRGTGGHYVYGEDEGFLLHERCVLVVICADEQADGIADLIAGAAHTGNKGDGIVAITSLEGVRRIRDAGGGA